MRDEQVRRYARHILLPDVGGLGQAQLLVAVARLAVTAPVPEAELIACRFLAAGGVGTIVLDGAPDVQLATVAAHGPDTRFLTSGSGTPVELPPAPAWWPTPPAPPAPPAPPGAHAAADPAADDALACWRGSLAAVQWMATVTLR